MSKRNNVQRDDGRYAVQVYIGRGENGKRKYKTVYGYTQTEADEKADILKLKMKKGIDISAERDTFGIWADRWLKIKAGEVSAGRLVVCECNVKHLKKTLDSIPISKVQTIDIQEIISELAVRNPNTKKPASKDALSSIKSSCRQIMQLAIDNRVMDYNPAAAVKIPKIESQSERRALTSEEQIWITDMPHRARRSAMIMMYAGLRRGELVPLMWNDVDLVNKTISVNKTVEFIKDKPVLKKTAKTDASIRVIDIPDRLVDFLKNEPKDSIYVCPAASGQIHTAGSFRAMWESYLVDLNFRYGDFSKCSKTPKSKFDHGTEFMIPNITPHWLRHTFATLLYLSGVDVLTAKDQLGHADIKTTLQIYTHLDKIHKRKSMNKLNEYLGSASQMQVSQS